MTQSREAPATRAIVIACVLIELAALVGGRGFEEMLTVGGGLIPARLTGYIGAIRGIPAPLTLLTSLFLHAGIAHLGFNMLFLAWIGRFTEAVLGSGRFLVLFAASGIVGGLAQVALDPMSSVPVIGASGAISGIFAAYALIFGRSAGKGAVKRSAELAALWIGLQVLTGLVFNSGAGGGIAIGTHIGGFVTGLLLAHPLARGAIARRKLS